MKSNAWGWRKRNAFDYPGERRLEVEVKGYVGSRGPLEIRKINMKTIDPW